MVVTKLTTLGLAALLSVIMGCSAAAAPFFALPEEGGGAAVYNDLVKRGKEADQHELHQQADSMWQQQAGQIKSAPDAERALWLVARADLLQFRHEFKQALQMLDEVIAAGYFHQQARLMQARIYLTGGRPDAAKQACQALVGKSPLSVSATCLLEVVGREGDLDNSYPRLVSLHQLNAGESETAVTSWRRQILAEQAQLLGRYEEALSWLSDRDFAEQPAVNQRKILDLHLAMQQPAAVLEKYPECPVVDALPIDSILVRIAHAEQQTERGSCWQDVTAERMYIRSLRQDKLHTSDLAYYFTYVEPDSVQAVHWAKLNLDVAREPADLQLFDDAKRISE